MPGLPVRATIAPYLPERTRAGMIFVDGVDIGDPADVALRDRRMLSADGISAEVVDLRTLLPLDREAIAATVKKTNRAIILHEDVRTGGIAGEVAAIINEEAFDWLDAPIVRITSTAICGSDLHYWRNDGNYQGPDMRRVPGHEERERPEEAEGHLREALRRNPRGTDVGGECEHFRQRDRAAQGMGVVNGEFAKMQRGAGIVHRVESGLAGIQRHRQRQRLEGRTHFEHAGGQAVDPVRVVGFLGIVRIEIRQRHQRHDFAGLWPYGHHGGLPRLALRQQRCVGMLTGDVRLPRTPQPRG